MPSDMVQNTIWGFQLPTWTASVAVVKAEAGAESAPAPTRRGDMPTAAAMPPPQQARVVVARQMVHKIVVELEQKELDLQAARCEVAELKVELGAAKAGHVLATAEAWRPPPASRPSSSVGALLARVSALTIATLAIHVVG
ncbi:hypothetical protein ACP70R_001148 [Stipagrostis hirtigluma subsp. patula]